MKKLLLFMMAIIFSVAAFADTTDSCGDPANQVVVSADNCCIIARGYGVNRNNTVTVEFYTGNKKHQISIDIVDGKGIYKGNIQIDSVKITNKYCLVDTKK